MGGLKPSFLDFMNYMDLHGIKPELKYKLEVIYNRLEDVYDVGSMEELQEAIDGIGTGAGTIFITAGTHIVDIPIDIDGGGSLVIYGHGDNTILQPDDGINVFNITDCASLTIKTLQIDATNYTGATSSVIINETNNNVITIEDVTIIGNNLGTGIELVSDNCIIEHCNISLLLDGIYVNNSNRHIIAQNIISNNARYGINLDTVLYSNIGNNTCNSNLSGIYVASSSDNSISNNISNLNTENGIYLTQSSYNTISGNTCENNDSNTVNSQAGIFITTNSDFNTISGNSLNNNNNIGAGTGYGIIITLNTCNENVVASNNANGNDVDFMDSGTATTIEYYVQDYFELQDAIDSIGTKSGVINLEGSFTVNATIDIDGNGSYIIRGAGSNTTLTTADITCFDITLARSVLLENFKIDASAITGRNTPVIIANETNHDLIVIDNIEITGIVARGWGVNVLSNYVQIRNCNFTTIDMGIRISGDYCKAESNICNGMDEFGINCIGDYAIITNNTCSSSNNAGIQINGGSYCNVSQNQCHSNANYGIYVFNLTNMVLADNIFTLNDTGIKIEDSNYISIGGNTSSSNTTTGIMITGTSSYNIVIENTCVNNAAGYGIIIGVATCIENIVKSNNLSGNNWQVWDLGTNSDFEYICSTNAEIQDAIDSIALKSGIITLLTDNTFTISTTIDIDGGGIYTIQGQGNGTILTIDSDIVCINLTSASQCILKNFKIDASALTTNTKEIINVSEASDNLIVLDNITITGDGTNGYGIELNSLNCRIENCTIDNVNIGINVLSNSNIIEGNNINNCASYGIQIGADYNNITSNVSNSNIIGIYVLNGTGNSINNNIIQNNTQNGIYLNGSSNNSLNDNICDGNDSNTANPQAGIYIDNNSDNNSIIGNTSINNNNGGAGFGYGIYIGNANCENNIVKSNNLSGNGIKWLDVGVNSDIEYLCSTNADIQDAIDSIALKSGIIYILSGTITLTATIDVDGGGDYIIEGEGVGSVIDCGGNRTAFNITSATSCVLRNFKIDADDHTANFTDSITVNEGSDNHVVIEHVSVVNPNGAKYGRGVHIISDNCVVQNCIIDKTYIGIQVDGIHNLVLNNNITATGNSGISILGDDNEVIGNDCNNNDVSAIKLLSCSRNIVSNNNCNYNGSAGQGIYLSASHENIIIGNQCSGNFALGIHLFQSSYNNIIGNNCNGNDYDQVNNGGGIWIDTNSDYNVVSGNVLYDNVNIGAGTSFGINIFDATCNGNNIGINLYRTNDNDYNDDGTGTILYADDTVYGVGWNGDLGTATKNAIYDAITSFFPIGAKIDYFGTGIKGVVATRNYEISIANGDDFDMIGWFVANGQESTPNCIDKFVRNEATSGVVGGSDDAVVVSHKHTITANYDGTGTYNRIAYRYENSVSEIQKDTSTVGVSGIDKNIPAKISAIPVIRMS